MFYDDSSDNSASISLTRSRRNNQSLLDNSRLRYSADDNGYGSRISKNSKSDCSINDVNINVKNFDPKDEKKQKILVSPENTKLSYRYYGLLNQSNDSKNIVLNRN